MRICIVGIGRVGLPLALYFASKGVDTYGIDIDRAKVDGLLQGKVGMVDDGAEALLKSTLGKTFHPTLDFSKISECDAIILTLGTPVD